MIDLKKLKHKAIENVCKRNPFVVKEWFIDAFKKYDKGERVKYLKDCEIAEYEAYIAGAEPREKRIAELEITVGTLRTFSNEQATCIERLKAQIEKMKCCANCKYFYCPTSSKSEKDGKVLFHNWNKEKQAYCDCGNGEGEKHQLWEIKEK